VTRIRFAGSADRRGAVGLVELELVRGWRLSGDLSAPEEALAAAELREALGPSGEEGVEFVLSREGGVGEGFRRRAAPSRVELRGSPRGLLLGTYATLEELGCRWPWPGEQGGPAAGTRLEEEVEDAPALAGRCLVLGERVLLEDAERWIVWAARNRLNCLFAHVSTRRETIGAAPETLWRERRKRAVALCRERGMTIEHGGHLLPELLGRDDLEALAAGRAPSERGRRALERHVREHPEADVLHLWGADLPAGAGGGREAAEAGLRTANGVAELVEEARPEAQVAFLAYHDTEEVPRGVQPRANVCLLFAPRERCYEHPLADPGCRRNQRYRELLLAHVEHFDQARAAPARVFEYWFDAILFAGRVPDLSETIAADLAFYRDAAVHTVQMLMTGHRRPPAPHPNPSTFARLAWNPAGGAFPPPPASR
jgi:hypothetical protein